MNVIQIIVTMACAIQANPNPTGLDTRGFLIERQEPRNGHTYNVYLSRVVSGRKRQLLKLSVNPLDYGIQDRLFWKPGMAVALVNVTATEYAPFLLLETSGRWRHVHTEISSFLCSENVFERGSKFYGLFFVPRSGSLSPVPYLYEFSRLGFKKTKLDEDVIDIRPKSKDQLTIAHRSGKNSIRYTTSKFTDF